MPKPLSKQDSSKPAPTSAGKPLAHRLSKLYELLEKLTDVPDDWVKGSLATARDDGKDVDLIPCNRYEDLVTAWEKALHWTDGLDITLSVMLASAASTMSVGSQLWVKILGPPSCGKTTLAEALSTNKKYVLAKSTLRGFHSGFGEEGEDNSLISKANGKTLITKDGDTLLQSPNLNQILAEARDVYDGKSRSSYRNRNSRDHENIRMTWLLCGTSSLKFIDSSELGERFLDCILMKTIDDDLEDQILLNVAQKAERNLSIEATDDAASQYDPELSTAMRMTGGYVTYLRLNSKDLIDAVTFAPDMLKFCTRLGKFVAYMRSRPSKIQDEKAEREFAARLVEQHIRLAKLLAVVINSQSVDEEVMRRTHKIAMDTSEGPVLEICHYLAPKSNGANSRAIAAKLDKTDPDMKKFLSFLRRLSVVEKRVLSVGNSRVENWALTDRMLRLYNEVTNL